jgi:foldase protein PrsA
MLCVAGAAWAQGEAQPAPPAGEAGYGGFRVTPDQLLRRLIARHARPVLEELIMQRLVAQEAAKRGISLSDDTIDQEIIRRLQFVPANQRLAFLAGQHLTLDAARRQVRAELTTRLIVDPTIEITEEDIRKVYEQQKQSLITPEQRLVYDAAFDDQDSAQIARAEMRDGAPADPQRVRLMQRPGPEELATADPVLRAAFLDLVQAGDVSQPIRAENGWHVLRLEGVLPPKEVGIDAVRAGIAEQIMNARRPAKQAEWLENLRREAQVQIMLPE